MFQPFNFLNSKQLSYQWKNVTAIVMKGKVEYKINEGVNGNFKLSYVSFIIYLFVKNLIWIQKHTSFTNCPLIITKYEFLW